MRLQIEEQLQAMLDLAQEAIGVIENAVFLIGQTADALQRGQGKQGVALTHFRQIAAVEQLQELDGELDVTDAALAGLDLGAAEAGPAGLVLDAPLDRFDFVDLGETEIFPVDERLNGM